MEIPRNDPQAIDVAQIEVPQQLYYDDELNVLNRNGLDEGDESDSFYVNNFEENSKLEIEHSPKRIGTQQSQH